MVKRKEAEQKHSGFEVPAYGVAREVPIGETHVDAFGNTHIETENGDKIIRKA